MMTIWRILHTIALVTALTSTVGLKPAAGQSLEELRQKYPWGALYVTSSSLVDVAYILQSSQGTAGVHQSVTLGLNTFIRQIGGNQISRNVAILHLDILELRAGYIAPGNSLGLLTPLPWSQDFVLEVAQWIDRYFSTNNLHASRMAHLTQGDQGRHQAAVIREALLAVGAAVEDPFVSPVRALQLATEFRGWMATHQGALEVLELEEQELHLELLRFQSEFDREVFSRELDVFRSGLREESLELGPDNVRWSSPPLELGPDLQRSLQHIERSMSRVSGVNP